jgi:prophage antirepressor-like protein
MTLLSTTGTILIKKTIVMLNKEKNQTTAMSLQVTEGVSVNLFSNLEHEFLMSSKDVANGYDVTSQTIRMSVNRHPDELLEGKHFIKGVTFRDTLSNAQPNQVFWTKRGIVRLGFFIKSQRAKLFRDWAEDLIINKLNKIGKGDFTMNYDMMIEKLQKLNKKEALQNVRDMKYCEQQSNNFMDLHSKYKEQYSHAVGGLI